MTYNLNDHMELARYNLKQKRTKNWNDVTSQVKMSSQAELYQAEKLSMFTGVNNLMTKLIIDKDRLENEFSKTTSEENMILNDLKDRLRSARDIINQLKCVIHVETSVWLAPIYENTTKDRQKFYSLKKKIDWMEESITTAVRRYNTVRVFLNLPKDDLYLEVQREPPFKLEYMSKKKRQEIENQFKFKETELILTDLRTPMELLKSRIVDHGIGPIYRFLKKNTSGGQFIYHYSCTLFGMYVEGSGCTKYEAKLNAASEMLRSIIRKQKNRTLSSHIRSFNEKELKSIAPSIKFKVNYVEVLHTECAKYLYKAPVYTLLSRPTNDDQLVNHYSIQCNAMDLVAIGHSNKRSTAKQMAAQNIMKLWEKLNTYKNAFK